ncbi:histidine kinase [Nostoc linckia]|nr:histidine kinase [Nostoc linckia]
MGRWGDAGTRRITNAQCPMPHAQCPMPNAQCPMPHALLFNNRCTQIFY